MKRIPNNLNRLLDQYSREIRSAFLDAIKAQKSDVKIKAVVAALERNDLNEAYRAVRIDEKYFVGMKSAIRDAYWGGGKAVTASVKKTVISQPVLPFDGSMPRSEAWVKNETAKLVADIVKDQRGLVRFVMQEGIANASHPENIARDLVGRINRQTGKREGGFIGLTDRQAETVKSLRDGLTTPEGMRKYLKSALRDERHAKTVRAALENGRTVPRDLIQKISTRYEARYLQYRGNVIAQNEATIAVESGRAEGFQQMIEDGAIRHDQVTTIWRHSYSKNPRESHIALDGTSVPFGGKFVAEGGAEMMYPHDPAGGAANNIGCNCWADHTVSAP